MGADISDRFETHQSLVQVRIALFLDQLKLFVQSLSGHLPKVPENDVNVIIDVEEGEVDALIHILQILDADWYVARAEKANRIAAIHEITASKAEAKAEAKKSA